MEKCSGVKLQELAFISPPHSFAILQPRQACFKLFKTIFVFSLLLSSVKHPLRLFLVFSLIFFTFFFHIFFSRSCVSSFSASPLSTPSLAPFSQGWPVWYSTCVVGQQDGLEHGQAPQTTLIYRTAFQSLFQCGFHLHKYKHGERVNAQAGGKSENNRQG